MHVMTDPLCLDFQFIQELAKVVHPTSRPDFMIKEMEPHSHKRDGRNTKQQNRSQNHRFRNNNNNREEKDDVEDEEETENTNEPKQYIPIEWWKQHSLESNPGASPSSSAIVHPSLKWLEESVRWQKFYDEAISRGVKLYLMPPPLSKRQRNSSFYIVA